MAIKDGETIQANDLLNNMLGVQFKNWMNLIWNADYIGWNAKLNYDYEGSSGGTPSTTNLLWDNFITTGAAQRDKIGVESSYGLTYDSTNDVYYTQDMSTINSWVIIEADDATVTWTNNNCILTKIASGKWLLWNTEDDIEVERAQIYKSLWFGTTGENQLILDFTNVTAVKTSSARDVGKQAFYTKNRIFGDGSVWVSSIAGTFADTSNNTACSSWSKITVSGESTASIKWKIPDDTTKNILEVNGTSDELGTDLTADELDNPATCESYSAYRATGGGSCSTYVIILCKGDLANVSSGDAAHYTHTEIDFKVDNSIPDMTAAGTLSAEGVLTASLISNDVATAVTNGIVVVNSTVDAANTQTLYLSADDGSNWEEATEKEITRLTNSGSNFKFKWEVVRTDLSKGDNISAFGVLYSLGAGGG